MKMHWDIAIMYRSCSLRICVGSIDTTSGGGGGDKRCAQLKLPSGDHLGLWNIRSTCNLSRREVWFFQKGNQILLFHPFHYEQLYCLLLLVSELWNDGRRRPWFPLLLLLRLDNLAVVVWRRLSRNKFSLICFRHFNKKFQICWIYFFSFFCGGFSLKCSLTHWSLIRAHSSRLMSQGLIGGSFIFFSSALSSSEAP